MPGLTTLLPPAADFPTPAPNLVLHTVLKCLHYIVFTTLKLHYMINISVKVDVEKGVKFNDFVA